MNDRREFLRVASAATVLASTAATGSASAEKQPPHVACNEYPWMTFYRREQRDFRADLDGALKEVASTGVDGFEPIVDSLAFLQRLVPLLRRHDLEMRSLYVNSVLHDGEQVKANIDKVLAIADRAQDLAGTAIIVTNPRPIRWGGSENKTDEQLKVQSEALDLLGKRLAAMGLTLAYHNHDAELRQAAREFHHMLAGTNPAHVSFCLDAHWIYRGAGDSNVALFDVVKLYGERIVELHLRQSKGGVWTEVFGPGDIEYPRLFRILQRASLRPHIVLEQAVEKDSPHKMKAADAQRASREYAVKLLSDNYAS